MGDRMDVCWADRPVYYAANKSANDGPIDDPRAAATDESNNECMGERIGLSITQVGGAPRFQELTKYK